MPGVAGAPVFLVRNTGALIGFERAARRTMTQLKLAERVGYELTIPTPVFVEAWPRVARERAIAIQQRTSEPARFPRGSANARDL
jgi:hypothetical protein